MVQRRKKTPTQQRRQPVNQSPSNNQGSSQRDVGIPQQGRRVPKPSYNDSDSSSDSSIDSNSDTDSDTDSDSDSDISGVPDLVRRTDSHTDSDDSSDGENEINYDSSSSEQPDGENEINYDSSSSEQLPPLLNRENSSNINSSSNNSSNNNNGSDINNIRNMNMNMNRNKNSSGGQRTPVNDRRGRLVQKKRPAFDIRGKLNNAITKEEEKHAIRKKKKEEEKAMKNSAATLIQALARGVVTRKRNATFREKLSEFMRFHGVWGNCVKLVGSIQKEIPDWASLRDKQNFIRQQELLRDDEEDAMKKTDEVLTSSMEDAMKVMEERAELEKDDMEDVFLPELKLGNALPGTKRNVNDGADLKRIYLSADVVKWLRNGDPKYIDFFIRRMKQLSGGERSRILAKRLTGTTTKKMPIYETYLEQKSGFRILWTEKDIYLLVWYIAKHHRVSRLMRLIDDSKNRSERQRVSIHDMDEMKTDESAATNKAEDEIFLDPLGNVPLKVYGIDTDEMEDIKKTDWTPALHLTEEEREVVETEGTVLLLGRSGTGKTVCICNRMEYDRQQHAGDPLFSQLFIARSPRLCTYVKKNIGEMAGSAFVTFDSMLLELEKALPKVDGIRDSFPDELMIKFSVFKREIYDGNKDVDPLIVWTNIRSFIKGSIEALQSGVTVNGNDFCISQEEYLSEENFGKKRCRLSTSVRKSVYDVFLKYKEKMAEINAWDNCDRIVALIQRLLAAKRSHPELFVALQSWCKWSKIYVDEVQDYTQVEILLFFYLSGPGNLFLAGDPAQNVTKGVEFRFDDIRSVGYHIAGEDRRLIPQKPKIVNVNFRSHAGILNAAAAILKQMFTYFPDSATQLRRDDGLFQGPRPGVFHKVKSETMADLMREKMKGTVILTHDERVDEVTKKLGGYELVYGIRRAKGLEFKSVIVMDFFSSLPSELQKPWRELLLNRAAHDYKNKYPEVEGHLKLLYTAVTRCIDRLFFAETTGSLAGDAFLRFMTNTDSVQRDSNNTSSSLSIATRNKIGDTENMTMAQDEWLASGITNAEAADAEIGSDNQHAQSLIEKAIYCFQQADNESFVRKAKIQLACFELRTKIFNTSGLGNKSSLDSEELWNIEKDAALLFEKLLKENLLSEAKGLGRDLKNMLQKSPPSSTLFERDILQHLGGSK